MILGEDILRVLDKLTKGRCIMTPGDFSYGNNPYVITKSSGIPGKAVTETPGLVCGNLKMKVKKVAIIMTLTESAIELANASGVNVIIAHHPIAEASNSGGVPLKNYLNLYDIAVFELHEAFHGLHPGVSWMHGYNVNSSLINYGGIVGNIAYIGQVFDGIEALGDILSRLNTLMDFNTEACALNSKSLYSKCENSYDLSSSISGEILLGTKESYVKNILHFFPHAGFTSEHLESIVNENKEIDTVLVSISRVLKDSKLVQRARKLGLNFICGNSHTMEIYENGVPLAYALKKYLKGLEVVIFRETITSIPLEYVSTEEIRNYGKDMAKKYL